MPGWRWSLLEGSELRLLWPVVAMAEPGRAPERWLRDARRWLARNRGQRYLVAVRFRDGPYVGGLMWEYRPHGRLAAPHGFVPRLWSLEPSGRPRTFAALIAAGRELARSRGCAGLLVDPKGLAVDLPPETRHGWLGGHAGRPTGEGWWWSIEEPGLPA